MILLLIPFQTRKCKNQSWARWHRTVILAVGRWGGGGRCAFEKNPELPSETWVHVGQKVELMLGWEALVSVWAP